MSNQNAGLTSMTDDELLARLAELTRKSRRAEADLVAVIAEVDARRLYVRAACSSMFSYCTEVLHLSEAEAFLRITAARNAREHPIVLEMISDGRLHLSTIGRLSAALKETRDGAALLQRAVHKTRRQIDELVAELRPQPDVPSAIRKLPVRRESSRHAPAPAAAGPADRAGSASSGAPPAAGHRACEAGAPHRLEPLQTRLSVHANPLTAPVEGRDRQPGRELEEEPPALTAANEQQNARTPVRAQRPTIEPTSPDRYKVQFTADAALRDKLERLKTLMRSSVPDGDLAAIIDAAVTDKLQRLEARRMARTARARKTLGETDTRPTSRHVPAAVKRAVSERDAGQCRFVAADGRRCSARSGLELHHRHPYGLGGDHSLSNVALLCRAHNDYLAEIDYGRRRPPALPTSRVPASKPF